MPQGHCELAGAGKQKPNSGAGTQFHLTLLSAEPDDSAQPPTNALYVNLSTPCREPASSREAHPWAFYLPPLKYLCGLYPQHSAGKLPDTTNRLGQQG